MHIQPDAEWFIRHIQKKADILARSHVFKILDDLGQYPAELQFRENRFYFSGIQSSKVYDLVDKSQQEFGVPEHQLQLLFDVGAGKILSPEYIFNRRYDQAERCPEFMGDVGKKPQFGFIQFFQVFLFDLLDPERMLQ